MNQFGLSPKHLTLLINTIQKCFGNAAELRIWIFGSRAVEKHRPFSDIDILLESPALNFSDLSRLEEEFEESSLPYKVDLVDLRKISPEYAPSIHASKKLLFQQKTGE